MVKSNKFAPFESNSLRIPEGARGVFPSYVSRGEKFYLNAFRSVSRRRNSVWRRGIFASTRTSFRSVNIETVASKFRCSSTQFDRNRSEIRRSCKRKLQHKAPQDFPRQDQNRHNHAAYQPKSSHQYTHFNN